VRKSALFGFGLVVAALVALGLVILSSASEANGIRLHSDAYHFMKRQFVYLVMAIAVAVITAWFDYRLWRDHCTSTSVLFLRAGSSINIFCTAGRRPRR
jgi:cell division protein FtsW (lipid II flippase)